MRRDAAKGGSMVKGYGLVHTIEYDKEIAEIFGSVIAADEFIKCVHLIISRNPYKGRQSNINVWEFEMGLESIRIYYAIREKPKKEVCLLGIKKF